jgi:Flp pilus assembly protein TadG
MNFKLIRNQRGAVTLIFLASSTLVLGASFGAIDLVRYNVVQSRLQYALDGAALSAGRNLANLTPTPGTTAEGQWQADAFQYFRSNLPEGYLGSSVQPKDLTITYGEQLAGAGNYVTQQLINMDAKGVLPLISTGYFKISSFDIQASNQAVRSTRSDLELVMALDNTGSMASDGKIDTLKAAAKQLSETVLGASAASGKPGRVFIGLVPFADTVNVGNTDATRQWLVYPPEQSYFINNFWGGCIAEPPAPSWGGANLPAAALTPTAGFQPLHLTLDTQLNGSDLGLASNKSASIYERIAPILTGFPQPRSFDANGAAYDRRVWATRSSNTSFDIYSAANPSNCVASRLVRFLSDDLNTINTAIDGMQANGNTLIPTGLLWGWRMLNPAWRGTPGWGNPDMPRDPDSKVLSKVIVLLTDGQNDPPSSIGSLNGAERLFAYQLAYDAQSCTDKKTTACSPTLLPRTYTQGKFTVPNVSQAPMNSLKMRDPFDTSGKNAVNPSIGWGDSTNITTATVDTYMQDVCANVKNDGNGIKIYTVTLGPVGSSAETQMNNCSSGAGYFYNATNVSDLPDVFKSIAGALTELRLTS